MITSTTISSIRVKPRWRLVFCGRQRLHGEFVPAIRPAREKALNDNRRMLARLSAFVIWALIAATAVFWVLRLAVRAPAAPPHGVAVGDVVAVGDLTRLARRAAGRRSGSGGRRSRSRIAVPAARHHGAEAGSRQQRRRRCCIDRRRRQAAARLLRRRASGRRPGAAVGQPAHRLDRFDARIAAGRAGDSAPAAGRHRLLASLRLAAVPAAPAPVPAAAPPFPGAPGGTPRAPSPPGSSADAVAPQTSIALRRAIDMPSTIEAAARPVSRVPSARIRPPP